MATETAGLHMATEKPHLIHGNLIESIFQLFLFDKRMACEPKKKNTNIESEPELRREEIQLWK